MPPRECDNDDCDYETGVNSEGRPFIRWVHVTGCSGPVEFEPPDLGNVPEGSFLAYLQSRK